MTDESESGPDTTETDLFESLEADVADRDGDPFETLSESVADDDSLQSEGGNRNAPEDPKDASSDAETAGTAHEETDWIDELGPGPSADDTAESVQPESETGVTPNRPDSDTAWRELRDGVGNRTGDPFEERGGLFEEMNTESLDPDAVWQELTAAESEEGVSQPQKRTYSEVSKHSYCEQCEHFSGPPDITCQHEGTEIIEFLDMETVRVIDCPVVIKRQNLERNR